MLTQLRAVRMARHMGTGSVNQQRTCQTHSAFRSAVGAIFPTAAGTAKKIRGTCEAGCEIANSCLSIAPCLENSLACSALLQLQQNKASKALDMASYLQNACRCRPGAQEWQRRLPRTL